MEVFGSRLPNPFLVRFPDDADDDVAVKPGALFLRDDRRRDEVAVRFVGEVSDDRPGGDG